MAKMFYSLEEAAERLGVSEQQIKEMAASGQLQQFRDRDKLMFKRDQVDALATGGGSAADSGAPLDLADSSAGTMGGSSLGPISLADSGAHDAIDISSEDTRAGATSLGNKIGDSRAGTGVSVFDAGEVDAADPMAQTQVTRAQGDDEELALESVGSGSGLLDLTRESDDTSLGAELLDEIYPGGESSDSRMESAVGSSGVFESALGMETGGGTAAAPSGLTNLGAATAAPSIATGPATMPTYDVEPVDPAWSGAGAGMLLASTLALILGLLVMASAIGGVTSGLMATLAGMNPLILLGALLGAAIVFGGIGFVAGRGAAR